MKRILMTGGTGQLGRFIATRLKQDGHRLTFLGRTPPEDDSFDFVEWDLASSTQTVPAADALIHCALAHAPGQYIGGEGDDPHGFIEKNVDGTQALFTAAKAAGVRHNVFLSSGAVYSSVEDWAVVKEAYETTPDTLYGRVKLAGEHALEMLCDQAMTGSALRVADVYGLPLGTKFHKWSDLFDAFQNGEKVTPHLGTEVHGDDLAAALVLILDQDPAERPNFDVFNVADLLLDRQDVLNSFATGKAISSPLPARADGPLGVMDAGKLKALGWSPGGKDKLKEFLGSL
ncbi:MAG: SDR family oxidoreductase [Roseibium sp.]